MPSCGLPEPIATSNADSGAYENNRFYFIGAEALIHINIDQDELREGGDRVRSETRQEHCDVIRLSYRCVQSGCAANEPRGMMHTSTGGYV